MDKNKIIIITLIAIIIALLVVGAMLIMPNFNKIDTKLTFESNSTITEGDSIKIKLTDDNGTALANQEVNITITDENKKGDYNSIITDEKGVGTLELDKSAGNYIVTLTYTGNDDYDGCNATEKLTIEEKVVEQPVIQQSTQSSSSSSSNSYSINNLPPSNDPYPETSRHQEGDYVIQEYEDGYVSIVDLKTGERTSGGFR